MKLKRRFAIFKDEDDQQVGVDVETIKGVEAVYNEDEAGKKTYTQGQWFLRITEPNEDRNGYFVKGYFIDVVREIESCYEH